MDRLCTKRVRKLFIAEVCGESLTSGVVEKIWGDQDTHEWLATWVVGLQRRAIKTGLLNSFEPIYHTDHIITLHELCNYICNGKTTCFCRCYNRFNKNNVITLSNNFIIIGMIWSSIKFTLFVLALYLALRFAHQNYEINRTKFIYGYSGWIFSHYEWAFPDSQLFSPLAG